MSKLYNPGREKRLRVDSEVLGQTQPWVVVHRRLEYPGEVVVAEAVNPEWGQPLEGDVCFRIIFYTVPRRIPAGQICDPRIAMAVPRRSTDPLRESLSREFQSIHEAKERYITGRDTDSQAIRISMEEREASVLGELARRETQSYSHGRIYTQSGLSIRPSDIFVEGSAESWVERLVEAVFLQAYPSLPFEYSEFPATLNSQEVGAIYRGLFQGDPEAMETAAAFGPALGMSARETPTLFDFSQCQVVGAIERELRTHGGEMSTSDLLRLMCVNYGLNHSLATLYLFAFVQRAQAEVELIPHHSLQFRQGGPFLSDRISWDLLQEVRFTHTIAEQISTLRSRVTVSWNSVLPYASLVVTGLGLSWDAAEIVEQERRFLSGLDEIGRRVENSREGLGAIETSLQDGAKSVMRSLDRLRLLCSTMSYREFHNVAVVSFGSPSSLMNTLGLFSRLEQLAALAPAITRVRRYLDEMTFGRDHQGLAMKRDHVVGRIGLDSLIGNPSLWNSVEESFHRLRREFAAVYLSHHTRYHREAAELISLLERLRPQVEALVRFNGVPEFGGPLGADVPGRFEDLMASVRRCKASEDELSLEAVPFCEECLLQLSEDLPRREAALVLNDTERAMRVYNRQLSSHGTRRILAHPTKEQLEKFINLVQVSDLSALANVLDKEVLEFLRSFVRNG